MNKERSGRIVVGLRKHVAIPIAMKQPFRDLDLVFIDRVRGLRPDLHWDAMLSFKDARDHAIQIWNVLPVDRAHVLPGDTELILHLPEQRERIGRGEFSPRTAVRITILCRVIGLEIVSDHLLKIRVTNA